MCIQHGLPTKLNVVSMKDFNEDETVDFIELTRDRPISVRFIEFMPFGLNDWSQDKFVPASKLLALAH